MDDNLKIALISLSDKNKKLYQDILSKHEDISLETYSTLHQFKKKCNGEKYSGLIVDIRTLIRSPMLDKEFYTSLCKGFPILQVDSNNNSSAINCFIEGEKSLNLKGTQLMDHFVKKVCPIIIPRGIRLKSRKNVFYNIYMYLSENSPPIKSNLWDISEGGCYVISTNEKQMGDHIWLTINELLDKTPICSEVKWKKSWGTSTNKLPGFGVEFVDITNQQREEINSILSSN